MWACNVTRAVNYSMFGSCNALPEKQTDCKVNMVVPVGECYFMLLSGCGHESPASVLAYAGRLTDMIAMHQHPVTHSWGFIKSPQTVLMS